MYAVLKNDKIKEWQYKRRRNRVKIVELFDDSENDVQITKESENLKHTKKIKLNPNI